MQFSITNNTLTNTNNDCLILFINKDRQLIGSKHLPDALFELTSVRNIIENSNAINQFGQYALLSQPESSSARFFLIINAGENASLSIKKFRGLLSIAMQAVKQAGCRQIVPTFHFLTVDGHDEAWLVGESVAQIKQQLYSFDEYKKTSSKNTVEKVTFCLSNAVDKSRVEQIIKQQEAVSDGINFARDLGNTPPNICTPSFLAETAENLAKKFSRIKTTIIDEETAEKLGMGAFLSVTQSSAQEGKMIVLHYQGGKKDESPVGLVGKGITFDTGGNSMKDKFAMRDMKFDMCGAASVLGTIQAIATLNIPINVVGIIPASENMVSSHATRPTDIVKTLSGQTVEIVNTDAEGRLVLCDAMTYMQREFKPKVLIDVATLTGAVIVALGFSHSAVISNNDNLVRELEKSSKQTEDGICQLPLAEECHAPLESAFADMVNSNLRQEGGSIVAACFLSRFIENNTPWAHIDNAGTSINAGKFTTATGRPTALLTQYLINQSEQHATN